MQHRGIVFPVARDPFHLSFFFSTVGRGLDEERESSCVSSNYANTAEYSKTRDCVKCRVERDAETEGIYYRFFCGSIQPAGLPCSSAAISSRAAVHAIRHAVTFLRDVGRASVKLFSLRDPFDRPHSFLLGPVNIIVFVPRPERNCFLNRSINRLCVARHGSDKSDNSEMIRFRDTRVPRS